MQQMSINERKDIDDIISNIVKTRKKKKLSQSKLAELCDLPQATISRLESFSIEPKLSTVIKVCNVLELKIICKEINEVI
ncbi:MAG: helix-turn-helix domain-containing protein [Candidatus Onthovivens sp.]|nr:helix-turn-helix domain-containing protein [Candidatus Onthovivens sp.]